MPRHLLNPMDFSVEELNTILPNMPMPVKERLLLLVSMNQVHVHD